MIHHSKPYIVDKKQIFQYIKQILDSNQLAENKFVQLFERQLCKFFGTKYAVCVSSGTSALHLALLSLGIDNNSEVIIPAFCCPAVLNAVLYTGAKPVIADVNLEDFNLSYEDVRKKVTKKTKAIILPHMFGYPAKDIDKILNLNIPVIEDTTQSIGAKINNILVGRFGKINIVSFYATKMITTFGEGGTVLTNDKKIYETVNDLKKYDKKLSFKVRYNYKLSEVQAAMGILQLRQLEDIIEKRIKIFHHYKNGFKNCNKIRIFEPIKNTQAVFYRFIIQIIDKKQNIEQIIKKYRQFGIEVARPVYVPLDKFYTGKFYCENSKILYETTLSLPIYPSLKIKEVDYVIETTKKIIC